MSKQINSLVVIGLAVSLFGAGCGGGTATTGSQTSNGTEQKAVSGKSYDPCELITAADVAPFYPGEEVKQDKHDIKANAVGQKICFYSIGDDMKFVQLSLVSSADMSAGMKSSGQNAETLFNQEKELLEADAITNVTGLGDAAYYGGSGLGIGKGTHVLVNAKGVKFSIDIGLGFGNTDKAKHMEIENALAKKVLERL
ncbi:MAG: hypothetical protein RDU25_03060 [Patescibacteria group bacterium]|nr:hypothetical protein [Patescibacteria group bacterium]